MKYMFNGYIVKYREYGAGAEIITEDGVVIADFPNHLNAEVFLELLQKVEEQ